LIEVLSRKLIAVEKYYSKNQPDFEKYSFLAISSIYGIDLLSDNVIECRNRLTSKVYQVYEKFFKNSQCQKYKESIRYVAEKNILLGDALTLTLPKTSEPIIFSEWCFVGSNKVKRKDYTLNNLIAYQPFEEDSLFSDLGEEAFIPVPLNSLKPTPFREIYLAE
jgi:hypothetical protein